jgi:hypothetical protein
MISVAIGYIIALIATLTVLPLFGHNATFKDGVWISLIFTVISVIRGYAVRRTFNWWHFGRKSK